MSDLPILSRSNILAMSSDFETATESLCDNEMELRKRVIKSESLDSDLDYKDTIVTEDLPDEDNDDVRLDIKPVYFQRRTNSVNYLVIFF